MSADQPEAAIAAPRTTIRLGWRLWLAVAFLSPIAFMLWVRDVTRAR